MTLVVNDKQKKILKGMAAVIILMLLFPPFHFHADRLNAFVSYSFIFVSPHNDKFNYSEVDVLLLISQVGIILISGFLFVLSSSKSD